MRTVKDIPVFFHNLGGYDSHIIFKNLKKAECDTPTVIAKSMEKFVSMELGGEEVDGRTVHKLHFKDSLQFLSSSLNKLVDNLAAKAVGGQSLQKLFVNLYVNFKKKWGHLPEDAFQMLTRKGVYPYQYMDSFEKFKETELPPREEFYDDLGKTEISDIDYAYIQNLWETFGLKTLGDLHNLYMETDVLLLADVFESFRTWAMQKYRLDPAHFRTAPSLSWTAALLYTNVTLEIPTCPDMHLFFDKGLTGGASEVKNQYAKANVENFSHFEKEVMRAYIMMFDANNQYGWAMSQYLPTGDFKWMEEKSLDEWMEFLNSQNSEQSKGYFFEVDLEYPKELHDTHDQYPLAPEHVEIKKSLLSKHQIKLAEDLKIKVGGKKLCLTLQDKEAHICHYRNLKFYLEKGLKIKKVRRVLEFSQRPWMKRYIELNTMLRQDATNKFEQDFAKLMNNSCFGKTCEDVRKYKDFQITMDERKAKKMISRPTLKGSKIYEEDLAMFQLQRKVVTMNKPRYVGQAVLDISKLVMYNFHYNFIMENYPQTELLFTDTDSFCYLIPTESNIYEDIRDNTKWFDFSNYPEDHPNYDASQYLVPGKFKDEMKGVLIEEFCGLRSKMYSILRANATEKKAANGVMEQVKENVITHKDYRDTLLNGKAQFHTATRILQKAHEIYTVDFTKKTLSPYNDKNYIAYDEYEDEYISYSYGHYKIEENQDENEFIDILGDLRDENEHIDILDDLIDLDIDL